MTSFKRFMILSYLVITIVFYGGFLAVLGYWSVVQPGWSLVFLMAILLVQIAKKMMTSKGLSDSATILLLLPFAVIRATARLAFLIIYLFWWSWTFASHRGRPSHSEAEAIFVPQHWHELVNDHQASRRLLSGSSVVIGYNQKRVVFANLDDARHVLVTGVTGKGKTTIAYSMLLSLLIQGPSIFGKARFYFHDPKGVTSLLFQPLEDHYGHFFQTYTTIEDSYRGLEWLISEMARRLRKMGELQTVDFRKAELPRLIVFLDDPQLFYSRKYKPKGKSSYEQLVFQLVSTGRQAGIHLFLFTPYAKGTIISTDYRPNFVLISGKLPKHAKSVVGYIAVDKLKDYEFLYHEDETSLPILLKSFLIDESVIKGAIDEFIAVAPRTPWEFCLYTFLTTPDAGFRTILSEGRAFYTSVVESGQAKSMPYPFSEVSLNGELRFSDSARSWALEFLQTLELLGIAGEALPGQARPVLIKDYYQARGLMNDFLENQL